MPGKFTKAEIIENVSEALGYSQKDIHKVIDAVLEELKAALRSDRVVELRGFGTFEIRTRKGRKKARNPKTGEIVDVKSHGAAVFRPGKELKEMARSLRG